MREIKRFLEKCELYQINRLVKGYDILGSEERKEKEDKIESYWVKHGIGECPICFETIVIMRIVITPCCHLFCDHCLLEHVVHKETCPICREPCNPTDITRTIIRIGLNRELANKLAKELQRKAVEQYVIHFTHITISVIIISTMIIAAVVEVVVFCKITHDTIEFLGKQHHKIDLLWNIVYM